MITSEHMQKALECIEESQLILETPMLRNVGAFFNFSENIELNLKLENMQTNGSFKLRGVINQFDKKLKNLSQNELKLVTFSAGNYGKAFSFLCNKKKIKGKVLLPKSAAPSRIQYIHDQGLETELFENGELLLKGVDDHVIKGWQLFHPLDDLDLIAGYTPIASEILKEVDSPDIVLVCCGGGALLAGISSGLAINGCKALVYGVEPDTASTMHQSFEKSSPAVDYTSKSIAGGLAPPLSGRAAYYECKEYVKDIILVSDEEIIEACKVLYKRGLKVEPSGCAGMAALLTNKLPGIDLYQKSTSKRLKVVTLLSGGNISSDEMAALH